MMDDVQLHPTTDVSPVRAIREDHLFPVSGEDALRALALAHCWVRSGQQGKSLELV